ncbi:hypothetical protein BV20DRAFT_372900 [Pilatotrama ljubarskyi]|nr:hypothetical protein BV20DRAFT_372900 [Pilatotrama ljubarskyi]
MRGAPCAWPLDTPPTQPLPESPTSAYHRGPMAAPQSQHLQGMTGAGERGGWNGRAHGAIDGRGYT